MNGKVEIKITVRVFDTIFEALPKKPPEPPEIGLWAHGEEILCGTEELANAIADLLDAVGYDATTGYYDPDEDAKAGETDELTGWWYVTV